MAKAKKETPESAEVEDEVKKVRTFVVYDSKTLKPTGEKFTGKTPGAAAKKGASRGLVNIVLRERRTRKFRMYTGSIVDQVLTNPVSKWMRDLAVKDDEGNLVYTAKVGKAKYISTEDIPEGTEM